MKIVHVSDIHFGMRTVENKKTGGKSLESSHYFIDASTGLPRPTDLAGILCKEVQCCDPNLVVCSGDLGWSGAAEDYAYATTFLAQLRDEWKSADFVINAGNHDVDLRDGPNEDRQNAFIEMLRSFYGTDFGRIFPFYDLSAPNRDRLIGIHYLPDGYFVASINSAASINKIGDPILVKPQVLDLVATKCAELRLGPSVFRVLVLHHHLLPFIEPSWGHVLDVQQVRDRPDNSIVANSARLQSWLSRNKFRLVLHGHKHLFHGREDLLWQIDEEPQREKLLIVGAGSAGVSKEELGHSVSHSFNVIDVAPCSDGLWEISVATATISQESIYQGVAKWSRRRSLSGAGGMNAPEVFQAKDMSLCHAAIERRLKGRGHIRNFISVVENSDYIHPLTASIGERAATESEIARSFVALHPEYDEVSGWADVGKVDKFLRNVADSYSIQHGPRLFSRVGRLDARSQVGNFEDLRPIKHALTALPDSATRAYVGLYNPEKDVTSRWGPVPGLVGIQFIPKDREGVLDLVMTFRNLELSFWWVVNMLESRRLLEWACRRVHRREYSPGCVTFFSSIAEWRPDPRPMFISEIDKTEMEELFFLVMSADAGSESSIKILIAMLEEKVIRTSGINIEARGLDHLLVLIKGLLRRRERMGNTETIGIIDDSLRRDLEEATNYLKDAIDDPKDRGGDLVVLAQDKLRMIVAELKKKIPPMSGP